MVENAKKKQIRPHVWLFVLYFFLAPMEDQLTGSIGTLGRYLALVIVFTGVVELKGKLLLRLDVRNTCMLLLMILTVLSIIWSVDWDSTLGRFQPYMLLPSLCLFTSMLCFTEYEYDWITTASIVGGTLTAIYTLLMGNTITALGRMVMNEANDPNNLAAQFLLPAALAWGRIMQNKGWHRVVYISVFAFITFSLLMTGSRGGFVSLIMVILVYMLLSGVLKNIYVFLLTFLMAVLLVSFLPQLLPEALSRRMFMVENYTGGGAGRRELWAIAVHGILPHVGFLGFGAGSAGIKMQEQIGYIKGIHNTYLTMIVEYGVLGLPAFLTMLVSFYSNMKKRNYIIGASMLAGICVTIFFLDSYAKKFFWNVILLLTIQGQLSDNTQN